MNEFQKAAFTYLKNKLRYSSDRYYLSEVLEGPHGIYSASFESRLGDMKYYDIYTDGACVPMIRRAK